MKIGPVRAEFFHADGQRDRQTARQKTDTATQTVAFRNFAKALKNPNNTFVSHIRNLIVCSKTLEFILNKYRHC